MSAKPNQSNEFIHFLISELCDKFLSVAFFQHHSDKHGTMERKRHSSDSAHLGEISGELMLLDNSRFTTTINLKNAGTFVRFFFFARWQWIHWQTETLRNEKWAEPHTFQPNLKRCKTFPDGFREIIVACAYHHLLVFSPRISQLAPEVAHYHFFFLCDFFTRTNCVAGESKK